MKQQTTIDYITKALFDSLLDGYPLQEKDPEIYDRWLRMQELVTSAKKFLLDVKLVQPHFDSFIAENIETYDDFVLPFKECFLAFDLPLKVSWINMNINLYGVLLKEVPREFLMPDEKKIMQAVRSGIREIKGVRIYQDEQPIIR